MNKRLKHNLTTWTIYSIISYVVLLPCGLFVAGISIAIFLGFFFGILNDILTQLRKLNGEKFKNIE